MSGKYYFDGFYIEVIGYEKETDSIIYLSGSKCRRAKEHYVCPFGGNPYPGTIICYYNVILPNGKKRKLNYYA